MSDQLENMSRDELLKFAKDAQKIMLDQGNNPLTSRCPFCTGSTVVSHLKCQVKSELISEWRKDVTQEEYENWFEKYVAKSKGEE